ncbi:hypothetical protein [Lacticaseibacillus songhuajiangensis]|jgi:hypothetical protein|uniref:hypothetical protein n=1 Tax=Lacticaseibacillus songhuajiangensis TaxID=1296539 RepID=UPI000F7B97A1|nr:hypothetical protein [Lacticaseibacillus songhuajiangensis]MCI1284269.1 hypothetical protein [Lacticaseibacillus songhuajiangensis]
MSTTSLVINILDYLRAHPDSYTIGERLYRNEVTLLISHNIIFPGGRDIFPTSRLHAVRLNREEMLSDDNLVNWLAHKIDKDNPNVDPREIWLTGGHVHGMNTWIMQISFE